MAKAVRVPVRGDLIHKRANRTKGRGPLSVCGRYGYTTFLWRFTTCDVCLASKK